jgi:cytochrome P450
VYFATTADLVHEITVTQASCFHKGRFFDRLRSLVGEGLATSDGVTHRRNRRLMQPLFHKNHIESYAALMSRMAQDMANSWIPNQTIHMERRMVEFAVNVVATAMFSDDLGKEAIDCVRRNVPIIFENVLLRAITPQIFDAIPIGPNRRFDAASRELNRAIHNVIRVARSNTTNSGPDLLSTLMAARDADTGQTLTDAEISDELGTILFAGTETVAATLAWALYEISRNSSVEDRLIEELDLVVGDREVSFADLDRLAYTQRVINETMRLHSVTLLMRRAIAPVKIGGIEILPGTEVAFSLYALHRDSAVYQKPDQFDPDRWAPHSSNTIPRKSFVPFGAGSRKCIGDRFAQAELIITLATILSKWKVYPLVDQLPREAVAAVPRADRLPMKVMMRSSEIDR